MTRSHGVTSPNRYRLEITSCDRRVVVPNHTESQREGVQFWVQPQTRLVGATGMDWEKVLATVTGG